MEAESTHDGSMRFKLGPVEKLVVLAVIGGAGTLGYWVVNNVQTLVTQQAVTNSKLTDIGVQIGDVPALRTQVTELKIRVDQQEKAIDELRDMRGLK